MNYLFICTCTLLGVVPSLVYMIALLMSWLRRTHKAQNQRMWQQHLPIYQVEPSSPIFRTQFIGSLCFCAAALTLALQSGLADTYEDDARCTVYWQFAIFFDFCFKSSLLWFMYFRAQVSSKIREEESLLKVMKVALVAHSIGLPIAGAITTRSVSFTDESGNTSCMLGVHEGILYVFLTFDVVIEIVLFLMFAIPIRKVILEAGKSRDAVESADQERKRRLVKTMLKAFKNSCTLLFLNFTSGILISVDPALVGGLGTHGATLCSVFSFFTLAASTSSAWERQNVHHSTTDAAGHKNQASMHNSQ
jgi:hypothetical protein